MYNCIIVGAGVAGLFCGAHLESKRNLILEKNSKAGKKLLLSGSGQCNLTHGGSIKDFLSHYGESGKKIRSALYKFNNEKTMEYFEKKGVGLFEREDKKVFPKSLKAQDVLEVLLRETCNIKYDCVVESIEKHGETYIINKQYETRNLVIATGGCSYQNTGSDGSIFEILSKIGVCIEELRPALVPIAVEHYPYEHLSGITFENAKVTIEKYEIVDDLLFTHKYLSGPSILNISRYAHTGGKIAIDFLPTKKLEMNVQKSKKSVLTFLVEETKLSSRFLETLLMDLEISHSKKVAEISSIEKKKIAKEVHNKEFTISGTPGFNVAMGTEGGVSLDEVNLKTFEHKKHKGLFVIGEALDILGDTGGYNLQFAFSSGYGASAEINLK